MANEVRERIAAEVRAEIARQQRTQRDVADILGIPQSALWLRLKARRAFRAEELALLADAFGVPVERFHPTASAA